MQRTARILVIDAEEIILKSVAKSLQNTDDVRYTVTTATTAVDGLRLIRGSTFDLILVDLALPGMNGTEVLRRIKNTFPAIPVVAMSGYSYERTFVDGATSDVSGFLAKPFTTSEIRSLLSRILSP